VVGFNPRRAGSEHGRSLTSLEGFDGAALSVAGTKTPTGAQFADSTQGQGTSGAGAGSPDCTVVILLTAGAGCDPAIPLPTDDISMIAMTSKRVRREPKAVMPQCFHRARARARARAVNFAHKAATLDP